MKENDFVLKNKEEFIQIYNENIKREGSQELLKYLLEHSDFFTSPASTRNHSNIEGGLCLHSINAYKRFLNNLNNEYGNSIKLSKESIAICGLLHDLCKADTYKSSFKNVKVNNQWIQTPYYEVEDNLPYGHGEKSVYIICGFMKLSREEAMIINWHMGGFDTRIKGGGYYLKDAFYKFPNALIFHISDLQSTYLDEKIN